MLSSHICDAIAAYIEMTELGMAYQSLVKELG